MARAGCLIGLLVSQRLDYLFGNIDSLTSIDEVAQGQYQIVLLRFGDYLNSLGGSQLKRGDFVVLAQAQVFTHLALGTLVFPVKGCEITLLVAALRFRHGFSLFFQEILKLLRLQSQLLEFLVTRQEFLLDLFQGSYRRG